VGARAAAERDQRLAAGLLAGGDLTAPPIGIYAHVPFCARRCSYCDFFVVVRAGEESERRLAAALRRDLEMAAAGGLAGRPADTLYFGGGTPSRLAPEEVESLLSATRALFAWAPPGEVTLEANPERLDARRLEALRRAGVNRLSLGVQTLEARALRALGRLHGAADVHAAARAARAAGFENLSFDLIAGLPGEPAGRLQADIEALLDHRPEHLSIYTLDLDKDTALKRAVEAGRARLPAEEETVESLEAAAALLERAGYDRYEISNFALPGRRSVHNLKYWTDGEFLGVGPSAWSYLDGRRQRRAADLAEYVAAVEGGTIPLAVDEPPDPDRRLAEAVVMGLRLLSGVDLAECGRAHGRDAWAIYSGRVRRLESEGWLETRGSRVRLTPRALPVANTVWAEFI
jgi:oxygen-independent coproporphyrinogen-3 oxidase